MMKTITDIPLHLRREIETRMVRPFLEAFSSKIGRDRTFETAEPAIKGVMQNLEEERAKQLTGEINAIPLILRREIEARIIKPFLEAFFSEIGEDRTYEIANSVVEDLARKQGAESAVNLQKNSPETLLDHLGPHRAGGALEVKQISESDTHNRFDIVRCSYVDMYEKLDMREMGSTLSCNRDACFFQGVNAKFKLTRTKTLMKGNDCCNFLVELEG